MGEIAPEEQFLLLSTIFYDYVKTGIRFSLRDKQLFEIAEVEITRVDCMCLLISSSNYAVLLRKLFWQSSQSKVYCKAKCFYTYNKY